LKIKITSTTVTVWLSGVGYRSLFFCLVALLLVISLLSDPLLGAGWYWSLGNGLGFVAMAGLLYLMMDARKGGRVKAHQLVSYAVVGAIVLHGLWFLIGETITLEYLKLGAPLYMWSGLLALFLIAFVSITGLPTQRRQAYQYHYQFKYWHRWISVVIIVASVYHIVASGFYLKYWYQWVLLIVLSLGCCFYPLLRSRQINSVTLFFFFVVTVIASLVFISIRNFIL
jgi:hypothetical protein